MTVGARGQDVRHAFRRLVGRGVVYNEQGRRVEVTTSDVSEGEPAYLDETEEGLGAEQTVILVWVAHVSVGSDQTSRQPASDVYRSQT
jgi:hypothetical protein